MRLSMTVAAVAAVCLFSASVYALTFSVDQPPNGSGITDGQLLVYNTTLGTTPDNTCNLLVGTPVDALHIGAPVDGLMTGVFEGQRDWSGFAFTGHLLYSLDDGDPFPIGVSPDRDQEVWVAPPPNGTGVFARGMNLRLPGDLTLADEPNLGLGPNKAFDDDVDGLDTKRNVNFKQTPIFFSIDDRSTLVPNAVGDFRTVDIFVRFADGGVAQVLDGVVDLGLVHQGDGAGIRINDDIDAMIFVNLDDNVDNNFKPEILYKDAAGGDQVAFPDLGDGILFSLDNGSNPAYHDLPYQNAGVGPNHFQASIDTHQIYLSTYNGLAPTAVRSHADLGLMVGGTCCTYDDIDALAYGEPIPEPGTVFLVGTAAVAMLGVAWRRRMKS